MPTLRVEVNNPNLKTHGEQGLITFHKDEQALVVAAFKCEWYPDRTVDVCLAGQPRRKYKVSNLKLV